MNKKENKRSFIVRPWHEQKKNSLSSIYGINKNKNSKSRIFRVRYEQDQEQENPLNRLSMGCTKTDTKSLIIPLSDEQEQEQKSFIFQLWH